MPKIRWWLAGALLVLLAGAAVKVRAGVLISELCDPRLNYASDRFIEIFNPDSAAVDLTGWRLVAVANGTDAFTWSLGGSIASRQALVAGDATTVAVFPVAFPAEGWSDANGSWNGRVGDGARLVSPLEVVTDYVVATGAAFENGDYVRRPEVTLPNAAYTPSEWIFTPVELASDASPGTHDTSAPVAGPTIAAIHTEPARPAAGETVHVLADVTDTTASITAALLKWNTAPLALPNTLEMAPFSGDTWRTITPIPAQSAGTSVYYQVQASNDLPATTVSAVQSYSLGYPVTVRQIQGEGPESPYDGVVVVTQGVVTAVFGGAWVIQDGAGAWNGLWVRGATRPAVRDRVTVAGRVSESDSPEFPGNTMLVDAQVVASEPGADLPEALSVSSLGAGVEAGEGVLVRLSDAACTATDLGGGEWRADDGSGGCRIGVLGWPAKPTLGSTYTVTGPVAFHNGSFKVEPRDSADVAWTADHAPPAVSRVVALNDTALRVTFTEAVESTSARTASHYSIPGLVVCRAARESGHPDRVRLVVSAMATGDYVLTVTGVADLFGNPTHEASASFSHYRGPIPPGYYDSAAGLEGDTLKLALHNIIRNHTAHSYDYAWTAYYTTDVRPDNGKVWDIYSDIPGALPPYLYTFGINQGGVGGREGTGYTREHTWCKNWFGGEVSPMYTDLFALYPCDTHVNGTRGVHPYGETASPQWISLNGSKVGPSSVPDYSGTVFEPIDEFKGDLARVYLYFSTRYYTEDSGWPDGPATDGAAIRPWALQMFLDWNTEDPVSRKEIDRNEAVYAIQGNRNPFVDRPEFVARIFGSTEEEEEEGGIPPGTVVLLAATPNPFKGSTRIAFELGSPEHVTLRIHDVTGALVRTLLDGERGPGRVEEDWDGRDAAGRALPAGVYFCRLLTTSTSLSGKLVRAR